MLVGGEELEVCQLDVVREHVESVIGVLGVFIRGPTPQKGLDVAYEN